MKYIAVRGGEYGRLGLEDIEFPMTPETPLDPQIRTIFLRGLPVTYTDDGQHGPTLVMVHGLPGTVRDFRYLAPAMERVRPGVRVVRLNMPGFGGTDERLGGEMTVGDRVRFVADVLAALDLDQVVLLGHSMGGPIAMGAAALVPERICGLVLLASVGLRPHRLYCALRHPPLLARIFCSPPGRLLLPGLLRLAFVKAGFPASTPTDSLFVTTRAVGALRFEAFQNFAQKLSASHIPISLFAAQDDPLVQISIEKELASALGGELRILDKGGHNIQKTRALEIAQDLAVIHSSCGERLAQAS